jgi:hypothetical protein
MDQLANVLVELYLANVALLQHVPVYNRLHMPNFSLRFE